MQWEDRDQMTRNWFETVGQPCVLTTCKATERLSKELRYAPSFE